MPVAKYVLTAPAGDDPVARALGQDKVRVSVYDDNDLRERIVAAWAACANVDVALAPEYVARAARYDRAASALVVVVLAAVGLLWWAETAGRTPVVLLAGLAAFVALAGSVVCGIRAELPDCDELVADTLDELGDLP
jgi:hypothetical protein